MSSESMKRDRFDFELGYMTKSPCLTCENKDRIPNCSDSCEMLNEIRTILARGISSQASSFRKS